MISEAEDFAGSVIDIVHSIWKKESEEYPAGYAVFYSPVRINPELMIIGLNPGGDHLCFSKNKETLISDGTPMEYVRDKESYPLARKTTALFESIGLMDLLANSLKTNLNFFRSRNWTSLSQKHSNECLQLVLKMIKFFKPKAILCESIRVFDLLCPRVVEAGHGAPICAKNKNGRRTYISVRNDKSTEPNLLIGITHLTGSRPSSAELDTIKKLLFNDLRRI